MRVSSAKRYMIYTWKPARDSNVKHSLMRRITALFNTKYKKKFITAYPL